MSTTVTTESPAKAPEVVLEAFARQIEKKWRALQEAKGCVLIAFLADQRQKENKQRVRTWQAEVNRRRETWQYSLETYLVLGGEKDALGKYGAESKVTEVHTNA